MSGLYLHIPFCNKKCFYCDFFSGNQLYLIDNYVDALISELNLRFEYLGDSIIDTIYFGGGTPSLLSENQLFRIFDCIYKRYNVSSEAEITIECNPENVNDNYVDFMYTSGINRISLGVQFLNDLILEKFNRNHSRELIFNALNIISNSSFSNLSIDLIYSVPGINDDELYSTLEDLTKFDIKHISAYSLTIADNSQLFWKIKKGQFKEAQEEQFLSQYKLVNEYLSAKKFLHYEVSNYALEGYYSRHNLAYWNQTPYLGVGVSAHSYNLTSRQWNHTNIKKYIRELSDSEPKIEIECEQLTDIQLYNEYIILKMRTFQGMSPQYIQDNFNNKIYNHFSSKMNLLREKNHFIMQDELIIPRESDLLISDYLAENLMY
ncbi:MAG: radical SAM family heme chaperone HemW [Prolixibacteraceae bacterium]